MDIKEKLNKYLQDNLYNDFESRSMGMASASSFTGGGPINFSYPFKERRAAKYASKEEIVDEECEEKDNFLEDLDISTYINKELDDNKFQKLLFSYIDKRGLKDSDVYNKSNIDRRLFSKIRSDENYHPSKETIISLASGLELNINELEELLDSASYSLPKNNKFDLIIRFCFMEKIYNLLDINMLLDEHGCHTL